MNSLSTTCCIAGGGPAGIMLGYLLARTGIDVIVLEKHADFFRDFRGDTVHPSTLQIIDDLGLLDDFLKEPHQKIDKVSANILGEMVTMGDFSWLRTRAPYIAMMPQWDFLNFLVSQAKRLPSFKLLMEAELIEIINKENTDEVIGAIVNTSTGKIKIDSILLVGADGRHSTVRKKAKLKVKNCGVAIDALWFRISRKIDDSHETFANITPGKIMVMINRDDYWQCAYLIHKGYLNQLHQQGLGAFQDSIVQIRPIFKDRINEINNWEKVKLLEIQVNRLEKWYKKGLLCIGDAAHAMSPVGGVGINLAIQDAVAASNILIPDLVRKILNDKNLASVQKRRGFPTIMTQSLQLMMHKKLIYKILDGSRNFKAPLFIKIISRFKFLSKIMGYVIGIGFRPEKVKNF